MGALTSLIPGVGPIFSTLVSILSQIEQNNALNLNGFYVSLIQNDLEDDIALSCSTSVIKTCLSTLIFALPEVFSVISENRERRIK